MQATATQKQPPSSHLLSPCPDCGCTSVQTIRLDGAWWCECMGCRHRGAQGITNHEAHERWNQQERS